VDACPLLSDIKTWTEIIAFGAAAFFFILKLFYGYFMVNASILATGERSKATEKTDYLSTAVTIKKGDHGSLMIHDIRGYFSWDGGSQEVEFVGTERLSYKTTYENITRHRIRFGKTSQAKPLLRLTTNEEATFSGMAEVASNKPCTVEIVMIGKRHYGFKVGQWRTSIIVLPLDKNP